MKLPMNLVVRMNYDHPFGHSHRSNRRSTCGKVTDQGALRNVYYLVTKLSQTLTSETHKLNYIKIWRAPDVLLDCLEIKVNSKYTKDTVAIEKLHLFENSKKTYLAPMINLK